MPSPLFQNKDFMRLWSAQIGSAFGSRITRTVLPIVAIATIGASPTELGFLAAAGVAAGMVASAFLGVVVDRHQKRRILIWSDLIRAAVIVIVPLMAYLDALSMPLLYVTAAVIGAATATFQIADTSYLPVLVGKGLLVGANSKLEATDSVAEATGPGMAGILVDVLTAPVAMLIDAVTYLWSALMLSRIKVRETISPITGDPQSLIAEALSGWRTCRDMPSIRGLLTAEAIMSFFGGFFHALYMILGLTWLGLSPAVLGLVISIGGISAFLGAAMANRSVARIGFLRAMLGALTLGIMATFFLPLALLFPDLGIWMLAAGQLFGDGFMVVFLILAVSYRQTIVAERSLGRVNATFQFAGQGSLLIGALLAGPVSVFAGFELTWWLVSCGSLLAIPVVWRAMRGAHVAMG